MNENAKRLNKWYELNINDNEISCVNFINKFATKEMKNLLTILNKNIDDEVLNFALKTILQIFKEAHNNDKSSKTGFRADIGQDRSVGIFSIRYLMLSKPSKLWAEDINGNVIKLPITDDLEIADIKKLHRLNCFIWIENYTKLYKDNNKIISTKIFVVNQLEKNKEKINLYEYHQSSENDNEIVIKKTTGININENNNHLNFAQLQDLKTKEYKFSFVQTDEQILNN